jgi:hypothetical protein
MKRGARRPNWMGTEVVNLSTVGGPRVRLPGKKVLYTMFSVRCRMTVLKES